jgi:hypothetical protein
MDHDPLDNAAEVRCLDGNSTEQRSVLFRVGDATGGRVV